MTSRKATGSWVVFSSSKVRIRTTATIIAGASMRAITATMWPPALSSCISRKDMADTKVMALTEPSEAAAAPASLMFRRVRRIKKE